MVLIMFVRTRSCDLLNRAHGASSVSDIVSLKDRGKYQGINEAVIAISNGVGPILGGVFAQYTSWCANNDSSPCFTGFHWSHQLLNRRWAFWINLPLAGAAIFVSVWLIPVKKVEGDIKSKLLKIDYVGSGLTIVSSILLLVSPCHALRTLITE